MKNVTVTAELDSTETRMGQRSEGLQAQSLMNSVRAETNQQTASTLASEIQGKAEQEEKKPKVESIKDRYTELLDCMMKESLWTLFQDKQAYSLVRCN